MEITEDSECLTKNQQICKVLGTIRVDIKEIKSTLNFLLNESSIYIAIVNLHLVQLELGIERKDLGRIKLLLLQTSLAFFTNNLNN